MYAGNMDSGNSLYVAGTLINNTTPSDLPAPIFQKCKT